MNHDSSDRHSVNGNGGEPLQTTPPGTFIFFVDFLQHFSHRTAVVLSILISIQTDENGWALCPRKYLEQRSRANRHAQAVVFAELKSKGVIDVEMRGLPPQRFVRVNTDVLAQMLMQN